MGLEFQQGDREEKRDREERGDRGENLPCPEDKQEKFFSSPEQAPARVISQASVNRAHRTLAAELCDPNQPLLRSIIHFVANGGPWSLRQLIEKEPERLTDFAALGEELRNCMPRIGDLTGRLKSSLESLDDSAISEFFSSKIQPELRNLEPLVERARELYLMHGRDFYKSDLDPCADANGPRFFADLQRRFEDLKTTLSRYTLDQHALVESIDLNTFVTQETPVNEFKRTTIALDKKAQPVCLDPRHLALAYHEALEGMWKAIQTANAAALESCVLDNRIYKSLRQGAEDIYPARVKAVLLDEQLVRVKVERGGLLSLEYEIPSCVKEFWSSVPVHLSESIAAGDSLLRETGGGATVRLDAASVRIEIELPRAGTPPLPGRFEAASEALLRRNESVYSWKRELAMYPCVLDREVEYADGKKGRYKISFQGAALLSSRAGSLFAEVIESSEALIKKIPRLQRMDLHALGTAERINKSYTQGKVQVSLGDNNDRVDQPIAELLQGSFCWERDEGEHSLTQSWERQFAQTCGVWLPLEAFSDSQVIEDLSSVASKSNYFSLGLFNDQEAGLITSEQLSELTRAVAGDLLRVVNEAVAAVGAPLESVQICPVVAFRVAHVGSFDQLFSFHVCDAEGRRIFIGDFSREEKIFQYTRIDPVLNKELYQRISAILIEQHAAGQLSFRRLDPMLQRANLELPEEIVMGLVEQFGAHSREAPIQSEDIFKHLSEIFQQPHFRIQRAGEAIQVTKIEKTKDPAVAVSYGIITQLDGSRPEEVVTFAAAKQLHEEGHPTFEPSARFWKEYQ